MFNFLVIVYLYSLIFNQAAPLHVILHTTASYTYIISARGAPTETQHTDHHTFNPITDTSQPVPINPFRNPSIRYAVAHMCRAIRLVVVSRVRARTVQGDFCFLSLIFALVFFNNICVNFFPPPHENDRVLRISNGNKHIYLCLRVCCFILIFLVLHYISCF